MKKITLLMAFLSILSWQGNAQVINEGFEGAFPPTNWTLDTVSGAATWVANTGNQNGSVPGAHTGTLNAMFYSGNYNGDITKLITPSMDLTVLPAYDLNFWYTQNDWGGDQDTLTIYYKTSAAGPWVYLASYTSSVSTWTQVTLSLPNLSNDYYIAFEGYSYWGYGVTLDDVNVDAPPSCPTPSALTVSNITTTSADLGWTENGTATVWDIEWDTTGFTQGTGNMITGTTTNPHNLTGLTSNTSYDFYVRADCGGSSSTWIGPFTFTTLCNTASLTYTQDFNTWPLTCWDMTGGSQTWADNGSGIAEANFWGWTSGNTAIMTSEPINVSVDARVKFDWSHLYSATYPLDSLSVDVRVLPAGTWTSIWYAGGVNLNSNDGAGNTTPGTMVTETINLTPGTYTGNNIQIRFYAYSGYGPDLFVDNLIVEAVPSCVDPSTLTAANITATSVDLGWTENGTATTWDIEWDTTGFTQGTGNMISGTTTNPHNLTGLTANTAYDFYVRAVCGVGDSSVWVGPYTFSTLCSVFTAPYSESFDVNNTPSCWSQTATTGGPWMFGQLGSADYDASTAPEHTGNGGYYAWMDFSGTDANVVMEMNDVDISSLSNPELTFWFFSYNNTSADMNDLFVEAWNGSTWNLIDSIQADTNSWIRYNYNLSTYTHSTNLTRVRFRAESGGGTADYNNDLLLDDVRIDEACATTVNLGADSNACSTDAVLLDAGSGPYTYAWSTGDTTQTISVDTTSMGGNGTYNIFVTITDTLTGCSATDTVVVTFSVCTGVENLTNVELSLYPNPNNGEFVLNITSEDINQLSINIVNLQGQTIFSKTNFDNISKVNELITLRNNAKGIYFVVITTDKGTSTHKLIVK